MILSDLQNKTLFVVWIQFHSSVAVCCAILSQFPCNITNTTFRIQRNLVPDIIFWFHTLSIGGTYTLQWIISLSKTHGGVPSKYWFSISPWWEGVRPSYLEDPKYSWVLQLGAIWAENSNASSRYSTFTVFQNWWFIKGIGQILTKHYIAGLGLEFCMYFGKL